MGDQKDAVRKDFEITFLGEMDYPADRFGHVEHMIQIKTSNSGGHLRSLQLTLGELKVLNAQLALYLQDK